MLVEFGEKSLVGKARSRPDLVRQVMDKMKREGMLPTVHTAFNRLDQPMAAWPAGMLCENRTYEIHSRFVE
ncbi:MAG: hypothetical protein NTV38_01120 [Chloroflexi bacterium]|nr:hypothetical protein [Chloroflexota bacterium]